MNWFTELFGSTLGKKVIMALTGIFLILFLIVHLIGNLQLLKDDGGHAFNVYADFMGHNPIIQFIAKGNFTFIGMHIIWALWLTIKNRQARGTSYAVPGKSSAWSSRNMGILGTIILVFLVIHLQHFWAQMHFGEMPTVNYDGKEVKDIYTLVNHWFHVPWYVSVYVFSMAAVAFHLAHGFQSAFQTLGLNHLKYNPIIKFVGYGYSLVVPALFAWIPIYMFFFL